MTLFNNNKEIEKLRSRIAELNRLVESYIGANQVLTEQLEKAEHREKVLQENLFRISGITENIKEAKNPGQHQPIKMHQKSSNWGGIRESLEAKAHREYWEKKAQESEATGKVIDNIDVLEKEVMDESLSG